MGVQKVETIMCITPIKQNCFVRRGERVTPPPPRKKGWIVINDHFCARILVSKKYKKKCCMPDGEGVWTPGYPTANVRLHYNSQDLLAYHTHIDPLRMVILKSTAEIWSQLVKVDKLRETIQGRECRLQQNYNINLFIYSSSSSVDHYMDT